MTIGNDGYSLIQHHEKKLIDERALDLLHSVSNNTVDGGSIQDLKAHDWFAAALISYTAVEIV